MKARRNKQAIHWILLSMTFLLMGVLPGSAQQRRVIPGPKGFPYNNGIVAGNTLYVAGQQGDDENSEIKTRGIGAETKGTLENLARIVKAAGFDLKDVVSVTVYLADIKEFEEMNKVYRAYMPEPKPTRTTVQVAHLFNDARIELSAIAVKSHSY
jgi:2-iminobutanoate/2-iminopropanoate deaminase